MELVWDEKDRGVKPGDKKNKKKTASTHFFSGHCTRDEWKSFCLSAVKVQSAEKYSTF